MEGRRISIFPLAGALLFPGGVLPLHVFEPRYRALVSDAMARDRMIGMIQPRGEGAKPDLFPVGCLGHIEQFEALPDGRYTLLLKGVARFRLLRELDVATPFRQVEGLLEAAPVPEVETLAPEMRAELEREARRFADRLGYVVDWTAVSRLDDQAFVNGIGQVAPFDVAAKQSLLEAESFEARAAQMLRLMRFFGHVGDEGSSTLQ